ncbi:hypothetical protein [Umezawaea tangerina]|uniref:DUF5666 domain-containing protein n=1 Tax=Umezawaea tangerina TaxID=84725 RepID=A0A2T0SH73_9PSEU|nr:hypothetical protein [Umezawaea tangerina]PRY32713.1 hypothetical protein CLV43_120132 [Umezawaea tangerina]
MRKLLLLVPVVLLLSGCASEWNGEVRFKVRTIGEISSGPVVALDVDGDKPSGTLEQLTSGVTKPDQLPAGVKVGDVVVCSVRQHDANGFDGGNTETAIGPCKRA